MTTTTVKAKGSRGTVIVHEDERKGCALCVHVCSTHDLQIVQGRLNGQPHANACRSRPGLSDSSRAAVGSGA